MQIDQCARRVAQGARWHTDCVFIREVSSSAVLVSQRIEQPTLMLATIAQ